MSSSNTACRSPAPVWAISRYALAGSERPRAITNGPRRSRRQCSSKILVTLSWRHWPPVPDSSLKARRFGRIRSCDRWGLLSAPSAGSSAPLDNCARVGAIAHDPKARYGRDRQGAYCRTATPAGFRKGHEASCGRWRGERHTSTCVRGCSRRSCPSWLWSARTMCRMAGRIFRRPRSSSWSSATRWRLASCSYSIIGCKIGRSTMADRWG
jgi:hypothetical protein